MKYFIFILFLLFYSNNVHSKIYSIMICPQEIIAVTAVGFSLAKKGIDIKNGIASGLVILAIALRNGGPPTKHKLDREHEDVDSVTDVIAHCATILSVYNFAKP
ncbi:MAG: hypothetical protein P4L22_06920 [Candidatus Babeliales bacterium]|nr:hypothetical protein [Candidatus Babeliales bacterium]